MAFVAGLAPARVGLKTRLLELLCIHGRKSEPGRLKPTGSLLAGKPKPCGLDSSMAVKDALTPKRTRLVGEERSECRDDRSKSGIHEFLNHILDALVSSGSLFIEQVPLFADNSATQRRLGQLMHAEALPHSLTGFAPGPLTTRTVSQRPGTACAITQRLDQVTERTARTWDDHRFGFGCHSSLAVHPNSFTFVLTRGDAAITS